MNEWVVPLFFVQSPSDPLSVAPGSQVEQNLAREVRTSGNVDAG
jgi:hypothetical protein